MGAAMYAAGEADASAAGGTTGTGDSDEDVVDAEIVDDESDDGAAEGDDQVTQGQSPGHFPDEGMTSFDTEGDVRSGDTSGGRRPRGRRRLRRPQTGPSRTQPVTWPRPRPPSAR